MSNQFRRRETAKIKGSTEHISNLVRSILIAEYPEGDVSRIIKGDDDSYPFYFYFNMEAPQQ